MANLYNLANTLAAKYPVLRGEFGRIVSMFSRRVVDQYNAVQFDPDDLPTSLSNLLGSSGAAAAVSTLITGTDLTASGTLTTLGTNVSAHDTQGATLWSALVGTTGAANSIGLVTEIVSTSTPTTGGTVTAGTTKANEYVNLTPAGTLATLTFTFPSNANSRIGQRLTLVSSQIITALTVSSSGLTLNGIAVTALAVGVPVSWVKTAASTWRRTDSLGTAGGLVLTTPNIGVATGTSLAVTAGLTSSGPTGAGIGYAAGAGSTVSQLTDRTTTVIINTLSGQITTQATSLAAGAAVAFTVTNSTVGAGDTPVVSVKSGGTTAGYTIASVGATAAGSFVVNIRNTHASTADIAALVINFNVIKGTPA